MNVENTLLLRSSLCIGCIKIFSQTNLSGLQFTLNKLMSVLFVRIMCGIVHVNVICRYQILCLTLLALHVDISLFRFGPSSVPRWSARHWSKCTSRSLDFHAVFRVSSVDAVNSLFYLLLDKAVFLLFCLFLMSKGGVDLGANQLTQQMVLKIVFVFLVCCWRYLSDCWW